VTGIPLATSRYQARELIIESGMVPVGITVGRPKWNPTYDGEHVVYLSELAPWGLMRIEDDGEFTRRYVERLDRLGVDRIADRFAIISAQHDHRGLVLLCYEPAGEFCHRRAFAAWWESRTGQAVPELVSQLSPFAAS